MAPNTTSFSHVNHKRLSTHLQLVNHKRLSTHLQLLLEVAQLAVGVPVADAAEVHGLVPQLLLALVGIDRLLLVVCVLCK